MFRHDDHHRPYAGRSYLVMIAACVIALTCGLLLTSRAPAETEGDGAPCQLPSGSAGYGLCEGFNSPGAFSGQMASMQERLGDVWDVQAMVVGPVWPSYPATLMDSGCQGLGNQTLTDPNMFAMLCGAHMMTAIDDGENSAWVSLRARAPFDFTERTGKVIFTVDAKSNSRNWLEVSITKDRRRYPQSPIAGASGDQVQDGITLALTDSLSVFVTRNGTQTEVGRAPLLPSANNVRNRFEIALSTGRVQVKEDGTPIVDVALSPALTWSQGYVVFAHLAYNPRKDCDQQTLITPLGCLPDTAHWDNMGFDAPGPLSRFQVAGTDQTVALYAPPLYMNQPPAEVTINHPTGGAGTLVFSARGNVSPNDQVRVNDGPWQPIPRGTDFDWQTYALPATFVAGANTIAFRKTDDLNSGIQGGPFGSGGGGFTIHRIDLEVPVENVLTPTPTPTPAITPTPPPTPTPTPAVTPTATPMPSPRCVLIKERDGVVVWAVPVPCD